MPDYMQDFDDEFEYKNEPDETTPDDADNANIAIHNTRLLKRLINDIITGNLDLVVKSISSLNRFDYEYSKDFKNTIFSTYRFVEIKNLKPNTTYTFSGYKLDNLDDKIMIIYFARIPTQEGLIYYDQSIIFNRSSQKSNEVATVWTTPTNEKLYLAVAHDGDWREEEWTTFIANFEKAMFVEGDEPKEYSPHQF